MEDKRLRPIGLAIIVAMLVTTAIAGCTTQQTSTPATTSAPPVMRTVTDMAGQTVRIPANITKVVTTHNPLNILTLMLAPDKLEAGVDLSSSKYINSSYSNNDNKQPGYTQGVPNYEQYLAYDPDIILYDYYVGGNTDDALNDFKAHVSPIPVVAVKGAVNVSEYPAEIEFVGDVVGNPEKADEMIAFYNKVYNKVNNTTATIPRDKMKKVYYAEGPSGLQTDGPASFHSELITIAGGVNVGDVPFSGQGMTPVSMEQVLKWDPDIIIASSPQFYSQIYNNSTWANVKAVREHRVYLIPQQPFNWFDRPPGPNRIIGIAWTAKVLYPELYEDVDMAALTKEFYSSFYGYDLTDSEVNAILSGSGLK